MPRRCRDSSPLQNNAAFCAERAARCLRELMWSRIAEERAVGCMTGFTPIISSNAFNERQIEALSEPAEWNSGLRDYHRPPGHYPFFGVGKGWPR